MLLVTGHNRRRGRPKGGAAFEPAAAGRGAYRRLLGRRWELETVFGLLKGPMGWWGRWGGYGG
ncbi:hypothetical protein [Thermus brockianus]|uniref:hypothetical protein n=1 Tax=Thermus brockianus TaxID=56956 RepID=UPI000A75210B|nr:hypothetical protein [Thermus brockianus]